MTDGRDLAKMATALLTSLLLVAVATSFVLPGRPSPDVIKAFFAGLAGAIASVIGKTAGNASPLNQITSPIPGNVSSLASFAARPALPIPTQNTPNQFVTGYRGAQ